MRVGNVGTGNVVGRYGVRGINNSGENLISLFMLKMQDVHKYTGVKNRGAVVYGALTYFMLLSRSVMGRLLDFAGVETGGCRID